MLFLFFFAMDKELASILVLNGLQIFDWEIGRYSEKKPD